MTEQLAFQKVFWNCVAVDGDKGTATARAAPMNGRCDHFFASAAFSEQEYRSIGAGHFANERESSLHLRTGAKHVFKHIGALALL